MADRRVVSAKTKDSGRESAPPASKTQAIKVRQVDSRDTNNTMRSSVALSGLTIVAFCFYQGFSRIDRPNPQTSEVVLWHVAALIFVAIFVGLLLWQKPRHWLGIPMGIPVALFFWMLATDYTTNRVCHQYTWNQDCTATPGGGPILATLSIILVLGVLVAFIIWMAGRDGRAADTASLVAIGTMAGFAFASLLILLAIQGEVETATKSNEIRVVDHRTPSLGMLITVGALSVIAWLARRRSA